MLVDAVGGMRGENVGKLVGRVDWSQYSGGRSAASVTILIHSREWESDEPHWREPHLFPVSFHWTWIDVFFSSVNDIRPRRMIWLTRFCVVLSYTIHTILPLSTILSPIRYSYPVNAGIMPPTISPTTYLLSALMPNFTCVTNEKIYDGSLVTWWGRCGRVLRWPDRRGRVGYFLA